MKKLILLAVLTSFLLILACEKPEEEKDPKFRISKIVVQTSENEDSTVFSFSYFSDSIVVDAHYMDNGFERQILTLDEKKELASIKYYYSESSIFDGERILSKSGTTVYLIDSYAEKSWITDTVLAFHLRPDGYPEKCDVLSKESEYQGESYDLTWTNGNLTDISMKGLTGTYDYDDSPNLLEVTKLPVSLTDDTDMLGFSFFNKNNFNGYSFFGTSILRSSNIVHDANGLLTQKSVYYSFADVTMEYRYYYEEY